VKNQFGKSQIILKGKNNIFSHFLHFSRETTCNSANTSTKSEFLKRFVKIGTKKSVNLLRPEIDFQLYFPHSFSDLREIRYVICIYSSSTFAGIVKLGAGMYVLYL
jgi:hypothetical protein